MRDFSKNDIVRDMPLISQQALYFDDNDINFTSRVISQGYSLKFRLNSVTVESLLVLKRSMDTNSNGRPRRFYYSGTFLPISRGRISAQFPIENSHLFSNTMSVFPIKKSKNIYFFYIFLESTTTYEKQWPLSEWYLTTCARVVCLA